MADEHQYSPEHAPDAAPSEAGAGEASRPTAKENLRNAMKEPGSRIRLIGFGIVIAVFIGIWNMMSGQEQGDQFEDAGAEIESGTPTDIAEPDPTVEGRNPYAIELDQQAEEQAREQAVQQGQNYVAPISVLQPTTPAPFPNDVPAQTAQPQPQLTPEQIQARQRRIGDLASVISQVESQIASDPANSPAPATVAFSKPERDSGPQPPANGRAGEQVTLAGAGTTWYSTVISRVDSYSVRKEVLAEIHEGPLAGAIAIGEWQVQPGSQQFALVFNQYTLGNQTYPINAVAVDPETRAPSLSAEVDYHVLKRVVWPTAIAFAAKFAESVTFGGSTTATTGGVVTQEPELDNDERLQYAAGAGLNEGVMPVLQEMAGSTPTQFWLPKGSEVGIMLLEPLK